MNSIPKIKYQKWWHRFIPYYRKRIKIMNELLAYEWKNGLDKKVAETVKNTILYGHYRIYGNK